MGKQYSRLPTLKAGMEQSRMGFAEDMAGYSLIFPFYPFGAIRGVPLLRPTAYTHWSRYCFLSITRMHLIAFLAFNVHTIDLHMGYRLYPRPF